MVIWINGAFGAGKSKVARRIVALRAGATQFDPERIGFMLRRCPAIDKVDDFQDLPRWRELTLQRIAEAASASAGTIVVPMTLACPAYFEEIVGGLRARSIDLRHFTLSASAETVRRRLHRRLDWPASRRWALVRVEGCVAALADEAFAIHVDTEGRSIAAIAEHILAEVDGRVLAGT